MTAQVVADFILRGVPHGEAERAFVAYLVNALQKGHLCVFAEKKLYPPSENEELILEGAKKIGDSLPEIRREGPLFWLERIYKQEALFKAHLARIKAAEPKVILHLEHIESEVAKKVASGVLQREQGDALIRSLSSSLSLLVGGPGTGKTYTVGHLIEILLASLPEEERSHFSIILAAPTGKAAERLKKSLISYPIESKTLHSLLGLSEKNPKGREGELIGDLFIIDEASMIDLALMAKLFSLIPDGARVILLGDPNQLPPVEAGSLFSDLVKGAGELPLSELKRCMRSEMRGILEASDAVLAGDRERLFDALKKGPGTAFHSLDGRTTHEMQQQLLSFFKPHFSRFLLKGAPREEEIRTLTTHMALLLPTKLGPLGVVQMNQLLVEALVKQYPGAAVPLMVLKNMRELGLFNGDVGLLVGNVAYFSRGEEVPLFKCPKQLLPAHQLGFALSVHKSQGSEFQHVALAMPYEIESFGRELFYTAITRARGELQLFATEEAVQKTLEKREQRLSSLSLL